MCDGVKKYFDPVPNPNRAPPKPDLRSGYDEMVSAIRNVPDRIKDYYYVIDKILRPYAETKGNLAVSSTKIYFELNGRAFTNFCVILLSVIHVHFLDRIQYDLELLIYGQNLPPKVIRLDLSKLGSSRWLNDLGPKYICETWGIGKLKVLIQAMAQYAPVKDEYVYSGWALDKENIYIMAGQQLCSVDWNMEESKISCTHATKMLDVAPHSLTIPLLAIALLSLVHSKMEDGGIFFKGVCCIEAPTQSFKTTLASLFFDLTSGREADVNFEATTAAIVRTIGNCRDSTVIVDDFKPGATKTENNELLRKLSTVIRMCSDDSGGIQKAGTQNSTFSNTAHGLVVVTAEHIQLQVQSTLARLLILQMNRKDVDMGKLTHVQEHHQLYRKFIQDFVRYIAAQGADRFCKRLAQGFLQERNTLRKELAEDMPVDNRTSDMCTWLWVTFGEFLNYVQHVGSITQEQFEDYTKESRNVFLSIMEQQAERVADLAPIRQFFRGLQVLIDSKESRLGELQARNNRYAVADSREAIGFTKRGYVYLKNGVALQAVSSYYRRFGREFMVSESVLRKALADNGYIITSKNQKSYIHRLSVNHESYQCIKFEVPKFYQLLRGGNQNGAERDGEIQSDWAFQQDANSILGPGN